MSNNDDEMELTIPEIVKKVLNESVDRMTLGIVLARLGNLASSNTKTITRQLPHADLHSGTNPFPSEPFTMAPSRRLWYYLFV